MVNERAIVEFEASFWRRRPGALVDAAHLTA
jgi:hypothetical protein